MNAVRIENAQLDLLARPGLGQRRKERALSDHESHKAAAIKWLRGRLAELYRDRTYGYQPLLADTTRASVNADDARRIYEASSFPATYSANRTFFGSIFRGENWKQTGERVKSRHPGNNDRKVDCWRYEQ